MVFSHFSYEKNFSKRLFYKPNSKVFIEFGAASKDFFVTKNFSMKRNKAINNKRIVIDGFTDSAEFLSEFK